MSILIKDTTREEREEIISKALRGDENDFFNSCDGIGGGRVEEIYKPYIEGKKEISEINAEYNAGLIHG